MSPISLFPDLSKLNEKLVSQIKICCVFGAKGSEIIIATQYDEVYAFGKNTNGCLGLGHNNAVDVLEIVNELCGQQITNFSYGQSFVIALNKEGKCYSFGRNNNGQLGIGHNRNENKPTMICFPTNTPIIDIKCGFQHTFALTKSGELYGFGGNSHGEIGCGNATCQSTPVKVNKLDDEKVVSFSCGAHHTLALTSDGFVYSWGNNNFGQLGIGSVDDQKEPIKVALGKDIIVKSMSCGRGHSLILANEGYIYAFGCNQYGQIGNGNYKNQNIPLKIQVTSKFKEISSHFSCNISIAKSINEYCFVWGKCKDKNESFPAETTIKSIHEIYAEYSNHKFTYEAIHLDNSSNGIADRISNLFNKEQFSDLKIKIEDKVIYVHKFILKISNEFFLKKFEENSRSIQESTENSSNENFIETKGYSYDVYFAFLKYIYTDIVDIEPKKAVELLILANEYNEEGLKHKCFHIIKNGITVENVCTLYCLSYRNNLTQLENYCFRFAFENLKDIKKTQAFDDMVKDSKNNFMIRIGEEILKNI